MKAALYARVSTGHQDPENQVLKLREFAAASSYHLVSEYIDIESGKSSGRKQFRQMMHDARRRKFEVLLFFSFSRFTREGPQRTAMYLHELDQSKVSYISITEKGWLDTTGPLAFVITMLVSTIAQMEIEQLSARTKAGLQRARAQGKRLRRQRSPIAADVLIGKYKQDGLSIQEIARRTGVSPRTVTRRLNAANR